MHMPLVFNPLNCLSLVHLTQELLELNNHLNNYGLMLTPAEAEQIIESRTRSLRNQGRVEINLKISKTLIKRISSSSYTNQANLVAVVNDMYEVFHYIKNAVADQIGDEEIIEKLIEVYNGFSGGSTEYLAGKGIEVIIEKLSASCEKLGGY